MCCRVNITFQAGARPGRQDPYVGQAAGMLRRLPDCVFTNGSGTQEGKRQGNNGCLGAKGTVNLARVS